MSSAAVRGGAGRVTETAAEDIRSWGQQGTVSLWNSRSTTLALALA
jgi:hypothetical protein